MRHFGPPAAPGLQIGLLGGSFDPPHEGHVHITMEALRRMRLDRVWWLVSPGNPLKSRGPAQIDRRMAACRELMRHPRVEVTDIESRLGTRYTADTLSQLMRVYPRVRFVWLMGADNLASFHRWEHWDWIIENAPIGVLARPDQHVRAGLSPAARAYRHYRVQGRSAAGLALLPAPAWSLLVGPTVRISSTELRNNGVWP
ncbi:MAG: nicotinate-nucleotide adenylyltransferase [Neomegalonema sp.]|nr:nicotinate-nucleotide adenylyltransferase [Neomegalonema sp.]